MCYMPDSSDEWEELDKTLLSAFEQWKWILCIEQEKRKEDLKGAEWISPFCKEMEWRLRQLEEQG